MTLVTEPADGVWLPLAEAAVALNCSPDTVRRRIKKADLEHRLEQGRYLVHVEHQQLARNGRAIVEDLHPSVKALLDYIRERDVVRDSEVAQLRLELARARADLVVAQAALPPKRAWGPFEWMRQLWATQT
jgi:DNA-binding Lrp family transcriptional regulator